MAGCEALLAAVSGAGAPGAWGEHLLGVDALHAVRQAKLLQLEIAARLQELPHDAVGLGEVPLQEQHRPALLQAQQDVGLPWQRQGTRACQLQGCP